MIKRLSIALAAAVMLPLQAHALAGIGLEAGYASWMSSNTGTVNATPMSKNSTSPGMLWLEFEHPVPVLPNIRYGQSTFAVGDATNGVNLNQTDMVVYWNLWDTVATVDVGAGLRAIDGTLTVASSSVSIPVPAPLIFYNLAVKIPSTEFTVGYRSSGFSASGFTLADTETYVNYNFAMGLGVSAGIRAQSLVFDASGNAFNTSGSGMFLGVMYKLD